MDFGFRYLGLIWVLTLFQEVTHQPWREQRREIRARLVHQGAETVSRADEQTLDDEQSREEGFIRHFESLHLALTICEMLSFMFFNTSNTLETTVTDSS